MSQKSTGSGTAISDELIQIIDAIKTVLRVRGVTYRELSKLCAIPESTLKKIFMGKDFQVSQLFKIANALEIDPTDLLHNTDEKVFAFNEAQETLFTNDLLSYQIFILARREETPASMRSKLKINQQQLRRILKNLEEVGLLQRLTGDKIKMLARGALQMHSNGKLQCFLEEKATSRLVDAIFKRRLAESVRHVGSIRLRKKTFEAIKSKFDEFNDFVLATSTREVRLSSKEDLIDSTYFLGMSQISSHIFPANEG